MTGWRKRQVIEMAREAGAVFPADGSYHQFERHEDLERFAELVREDATAEANARANASWAMMCEKMVVIEREACAMTAENTSVYDRYSPEDTIADAIRKRGQA